VIGAVKRTALRCATGALAICTAVITSSPAPVSADPQDDKERVDRASARTHAALEVADERARAAAVAYTRVNGQLPAARRRLAVVQGQLAGAQVAARAAERAARKAEARRAVAANALNRARAVVDAARERIGKFARDAYRGRDIERANALLGGIAPTDFVTALEYLDQVSQRQREALEAATAARLVAKEKEAVAAANAQAAAAARKRARDAVVAAQRSAAQARAAATALAALSQQRQRALRATRRERAGILRRYQELRAESARIAAEIRGIRGGPPVLLPGGVLPMPAQGWKSSDFGMRFDPYYHVWQLHAGVDIAAGGGAPIRVVLGGRVLRAGWNGGYGNYTCVYHGIYKGRSLSTCYAHQSQILVRVGEWVSRGELIGRVGTTGASTGTHLHFEVRLNGNPVNPLPYLPACLC
jgi:murein DD-endopeptidase MepM/ murein hydrolase activator NlpD